MGGHGSSNALLSPSVFFFSFWSKEEGCIFMSFKTHYFPQAVILWITLGSVESLVLSHDCCLCRDMAEPKWGSVGVVLSESQRQEYASRNRHLDSLWLLGFLFSSTLLALCGNPGDLWPSALEKYSSIFPPSLEKERDLLENHLYFSYNVTVNLKLPQEIVFKKWQLWDGEMAHNQEMANARISLLLSLHTRQKKKKKKVPWSQGPHPICHCSSTELRIATVVVVAVTRWTFARQDICAALATV